VSRTATREPREGRGRCGGVDPDTSIRELSETALFGKVDWISLKTSFGQVLTRYRRREIPLSRVNSEQFLGSRAAVLEHYLDTVISGGQLMFANAGSGHWPNSSCSPTVGIESTMVTERPAAPEQNSRMKQAISR
jgi:hypothetical protein